MTGIEFSYREYREMVKFYFNNRRYSKLVYDRKYKLCIKMLNNAIEIMEQTIKTLEGFERGKK